MAQEITKPILFDYIYSVNMINIEPLKISSFHCNTLIFK